jgi:hypothetical protein
MKQCKISVGFNDGVSKQYSGDYYYKKRGQKWKIEKISTTIYD